MRGKTLLHILAEKDCDQIGDFLKDFITKENLNAQDNKKCTPLHISACICNIKMVELFLENGADPNIKNENGKTTFDLLPEVSKNRAPNQADKQKIKELLKKKFKHQRCLQNYHLHQQHKSHKNKSPNTILK